MRMYMLLFSLVFLALSAQGQVTNPYFYEITKDGRISYVLGTMHKGVGIQELPKYVLDFMEKAEQFAGEGKADIEVVNFMIGYSNILNFAVGSLKKRNLPGNLSESLKRKLISYGVPKEIANLLRKDDLCSDWVWEAKYEYQRSRKFLDAEIESYILSEGKPQFALEDDEIREVARTKAWKNAGKTPKLPQRICLLKDLEKYSAEYFGHRLVSFDVEVQKYKNGQLEDEGELDLETFYRNEAWIPTIEKLHSKAVTFFYVGVDHLIAKGNIFDMLRARGFEVKKVEAP
jgi:hypothetical protein